MSGWNPNTHYYCIDCPYYKSKGTYVYELEKDVENRKCIHLARCFRVHVTTKQNVTCQIEFKF